MKKRIFAAVAMGSGKRLRIPLELTLVSSKAPFTTSKGNISIAHRSFTSEDL
jgi:hypothetical protein